MSKGNDTFSFTAVEREPTVRGRGTNDPKIAAMVAAFEAIGADTLGRKFTGLQKDGADLLYSDEKAASKDSQAVRKHLATALGITASKIKTRVSPRGQGKNKRYTFELRLRD